MSLPHLKINQLLDLSPAEPLWKRVPLRDDEGRLLSDFMMIIPKLRTKPPEIIKEVVTQIERILLGYEKHIVFADLNLKLNVLWVSVKPIPGICLEMATVINHHVPDAKLVAQKIRSK